MLITDIFQYPVKGLSEETLTEVELVVDTGMPADRLFAITHGKSRFDHTNPAWVPRKNFAVVAHSPEISPILCRFDQSTLTLTLAHNGETILQETVGSNDMEPNLNAALSSLMKAAQPGPYQLVTLGDERLTDIPTPTVSLMNTKSLQVLEAAVGEPLIKRRFRGNIWFEGDAAWQENNLVGQSLQIGNVKLRVTERIQRCAAVDADPVLGVRNLQVLKQLNRSFDHADFGVLATVEVAGVIKVGDAIVS